MENNQNERKVLLRISHLKQWFPLKKTSIGGEQLYVKANDDISLDIYEGETLGLVGESGCGKSTLGRVLLQLYHQTEGKTMYYGRSVESLAPSYVSKALKNLESGRSKLRDLEAKRDRISKEYDALDEKGRRAKHHEKRQAEKEAYHQMLDLAQLVGGLLAAPDLKPVSEAYQLQYQSAIDLHKLNESCNECQIQQNALLARAKAKKEAGKSGASEQAKALKLDAKIQEYQKKILEKEKELAERHAKVDALREQHKSTGTTASTWQSSNTRRCASSAGTCSSFSRTPTPP